MYPPAHPFLLSGTSLMSSPQRSRLDQRRKELTQQKEDLLKQSKAKSTTMDNVKAQVDQLMKVGFSQYTTLCLFLITSFH